MSSILLPSRLDKYVKIGSSLGNRGAERLTLSCTPWGEEKKWKKQNRTKQKPHTQKKEIIRKSSQVTQYLIALILKDF